METPELFVGRDRARRFTRRIKDVLTERRLAWVGQDVGMSSLVNAAETTLVEAIAEMRQTIEDVRETRIRDRERGYTEIPLAATLESVIERCELVCALDRAMTHGKLPAIDGRKTAISLLEASLARLAAFVRDYDDKSPVALASPLDLGALLESIESEAAWRRRLATRRDVRTTAVDRRPPPVKAPAEALDDVLRAARAILPEAPGPWRVGQSADGAAIVLSLGAARPQDVPLPPSPRLGEALSVAGLRVPIEVEVLGTLAEEGGLLSPPPEAGDAQFVSLRLPAGADLEDPVEAFFQKRLALSPAGERAAAALRRAPAVGADGTPPGERALAWMGLLAALEEETKRAIVGRARTHGCRMAAGGLPRIDTRKAPLLPAVLETLQRAWPDIEAHRVESIAGELAAGKVGTPRAAPADAATIVALVGRPWQAATFAVPRALVLAPLDPAEVDALVHDLFALAATRRRLEAGEALPRAAVLAFERTLLEALARLARVQP